MNNNNPQDSSLSLPSVDPSHLQSNQVDSASQSAQPSQSTQPMPQPAAPASAQAQPEPAPANLSASPATNLIAEDVDLIEKEWVERAKDIVHKTKDNPYLQNQALTQMKVDYIKKRYNKDIQMSE